MKADQSPVAQGVNLCAFPFRNALGAAHAHRRTLAGFRAVAAVPASAPAYGRRAKPGSMVALGAAHARRRTLAGFRAVAAVPASAPAYGRRAKPGSMVALGAAHARRRTLAGFRAVAAVPASAPAYGRRAKPGSRTRAAPRWITLDNAGWQSKSPERKRGDTGRKRAPTTDSVMAIGAAAILCPQRCWKERDHD